MATTIYTTANGTRYIKVYRMFKKQIIQRNIRIPGSCTESELAELLKQAKEIELSLFPHPKVNFLDWYWSTGKPKCISLDRSNLRLSISKTLVERKKLKLPTRVAVGIEGLGIPEAINKITQVFFAVHGDELEHVNRDEFDLKLKTWLTANYGIGGSKCSSKNPN